MARFTLAVIRRWVALDGRVNIMTGCATDPQIIWTPAAACLEPIWLGTRAAGSFRILRFHRSSRGMALAAEIGFFSGREMSRIEDAYIFVFATLLKGNMLSTWPVADLASISEWSMDEI
jgi:hypothetical protein